jgi:hypothetical protein
MNVVSIGLTVFGPNKAEQSLYEDLGFEPTWPRSAAPAPRCLSLRGSVRSLEFECTRSVVVEIGGEDLGVSICAAPETLPPPPKPGNGAPETGGESGNVPVALVGPGR